MSIPIRVFKSVIIREQLTDIEINALVDEFKAYKQGILPDTFGRDVLYDHPHNLAIVKNEEVRHLHLSDDEQGWKSDIIQYYRRSDNHLIYCPAAMTENCFLLIAILNPEAHQKAKDNDTMWKLGKMAENFRKKY